MFRDLPVRGTVACRRARRDVQDPLRDAVRDPQGPGQPLGRAVALHECILRGGGHLQLRGITPPRVELLARGGGETHRELELPRCYRGALALHAGRTLVHRLGLLGNRHPHEPVGIGLHDHQHGFVVARVQQHVRGFGESAGQRGDLIGRGIIAAHSTVVGVGHGHGSVREHAHPQAVLEPCLIGRPVPEPEIEQSESHGGLHQCGSVLTETHAAQRGGLRVRDPHGPVGVLGQAGGLGEPALVRGTVAQSLVPGARQHGERPGARVEREQLVRPGHRDHQGVRGVGPGDVPRGGQRHGRGRGVLRDLVGVHAARAGVVEQALDAVARQSAHRAGTQFDAAQPVVDGVRDHEVVADVGTHALGQHGNALGFIEARGVPGSVRPALGARTDGPTNRGEVLLELDQAVVAGVADHEGTVRKSHDLAGEPQVPLGLRARDVGAVPAVQGPLGVVLGHEFGHEGFQPLDVSLAREVRHDVPLGVYDHQGGPRARRVGVPRAQPGVVEHRVGDLVAVHRRSEGVRVRLVLELGGMHTHGHEHVRVLLLERAQLVQHVQAVDAAEGPEVQDHDLAPQRLQVQRLAAGVEPGPALQLRGANGCGHACSGHGGPSTGVRCLSLPTLAARPRFPRAA